MDKEVLCDSLAVWLRTFNTSGPQSTVDDLASGVAMSQVLHQLAPQFFNETWLTKIKPDVGDNWRLKVSNLKKILKGILDFYSEVLTQQIHDFQMPDVNAIGEHGDVGEMGRLLQLILGTAVNCKDKQEYIQCIMGMEESVQHVIMSAIQELMTKEAPSQDGDEISEQLKRTLEDLNRVVAQKEEMAQRCHELDLQVTTLQEERHSLMQDVLQLNERLLQAESLDDPSTPAGRRHQQLQSTVEKQQEENFRLESMKEDLRIRVELQEKEILDLQQKNEESALLTEQALLLKDEVDILRHTADKVTKYEQTFDTYKKKLEEMSDVKNQLKLLEDKNTNYIQTNMELEEEVRKLQSYKTQIEAYKRQVQEYQIQATDELKRADKAEFELKRVQEKMQTVQEEKLRLRKERDSLKDVNDELSLAQLQKNSVIEGPGQPDGSGFQVLALPLEAREQFMRLQHENKMLKMREEEGGDEPLQNMLDDANRRKNELETESRILNQRVLELSAQIEDLQESQQNITPPADALSTRAATEMRQQLVDNSQRIKEMDASIQKSQAVTEDAESRLVATERRETHLREQLNKKEEEMRVMEERYRKYLEKARNVIKSLNAQQNDTSSTDLGEMKTQLQEKNMYIKHLEKDYEKSKNVRDQEERLMVSAWYNLGTIVNRNAAEDRLAHSAGGQSFLARQRQAQTHTRRTHTSATPQTDVGSR